MSSGAYGRLARNAALATSIAALTAACSQSGDPGRGVASDASRPSLSRPAFTEDEYGVSSSPRLAGASGPVRKGGGAYKLGSPYKVAERWYVPREEPGYDHQGIASWYGDDFHGRKTANGEIFDMTALTAAHPTMPLPCYAYVTNLQNGRTILVRVNDRGPYVNDRLIDLSHASARALGYEGQGMSRVRVRYAGRAPLNGDDRRERMYLAEQPWYRGRDGTAVASARPPQAPVYPPQEFPAGTPGRWSPSAYRASLAGKPDPKPMPRVADAGMRSWQPTSSLTRGPALPWRANAPVAASNLAPSNSGPSNSGRAYVQVGVFRDRSNAERLRRELGTLGPVEVAPLAASQGGELYRVRLGPMGTAEANATMGQVTAHGVGGSTVVYE